MTEITGMSIWGDPYVSMDEAFEELQGLDYCKLCGEVNDGPYYCRECTVEENARRLPTPQTKEPP